MDKTANFYSKMNQSNNEIRVLQRIIIDDLFTEMS